MVACNLCKAVYQLFQHSCCCQVVIETPANMVSSILQDELGSGFPDEDTSSGSRDLNLEMDDEDYHSKPVRIPVECKLPAVTNQVGCKHFLYGNI